MSPFSNPVTPKTATLLALSLCAAAIQAHAQGRPGPGGPGGPSGSSWGLGIGVASTQKAYTGIERDNKGLPLLHYENEYVRVFGPSVEAKLPDLDLDGSQRLEFRILGQFHGAGYEADDAPILAGMAERKSGFWAGARVEWKNDVADLSAEWLADASSHSKGQRFSLGVEKTWRLGQNVMLTPRVEAQWLDKKYVDYYYGVRAAEASAARTAYTGVSGTNLSLDLRALYRLDANQSLMLKLGVTGLAKGIKNSSLVDSSTENTVMLGYLYRF